DSYLDGATEVDVDALCDGEAVHVSGIMEHIEEAGVHSGDSACSLPPHTLPKTIVDELIRQTEALARELQVVGLMNVQYAIKGEDVYLIEVNPRASRTVPFVAKATDSAIASIAARLMAGEKLSAFTTKPPHAPVGDDVVIPMGDSMALADFRTPWYSVKEAVLPFARFPGVDTLLGPEMRSTGEVMGWDRNFARAFLKAQLGAGTTLPEAGTVFFSIRDADKTDQLLETAEMLHELDLKILSTRGTAKFLTDNGIPSDIVNKAYEGGRTIVDVMKDGEIDLVINTTEGAQAIEDSRSMRNVTLMDKIPYYTTAAAAHAAALAMVSRNEGALQVRSLQGA
ncbi:MAG: ATP-grasp domain-containing protein, partial [Pseudomonadota bacterium]